jgi:hypothetical protein
VSKRDCLTPIFLLAFCFHQLSIAQESKPFFEQFKPSVGLVEKIERGGRGTDSVFVQLGTAFLVGNRTDGVFVISNRHVFDNRETVILRVHQADNRPSVLFLVHLRTSSGTPLWIGHPDSRVDIAAVKLSLDSAITLNDVEPRITTIQFSLFADSSDVVEGDDVFFIGFPLGLRTTDNSYPLLRAGTVALLPTEDFLVTASQDTIGKDIYLLDAMSIGGSSGSPVFMKPGLNRPVREPGLWGNVTKSKLIGILSGHVVDLQPVSTPSGKGVASGNAALAIVHPASQILETIRQLWR